LRHGKSGRRTRKRLPHGALLLLSLLLAAATSFLTWPARGAVFCAELPQLTVLAICGAVLFIFSVRSLAAASSLGQDRRISGAAAILSALAFFLSIHFVAQYRQPCVAVQKTVQPASPPAHW
jgi:NADH:ubiquinone oxidoreductase subunit 6 (subunit J)